MVDEGFISELTRATAEESYNKWIEKQAKSQSMYLLAVEGTK